MFRIFLEVVFCFSCHSVSGQAYGWLPGGYPPPTPKPLTTPTDGPRWGVSGPGATPPALLCTHTGLWRCPIDSGPGRVRAQPTPLPSVRTSLVPSREPREQWERAASRLLSPAGADSGPRDVRLGGYDSPPTMPRFPPHRPAQAGEGRVQRRGIHPRCVSLHSVAGGIDHADRRVVLALIVMAVAEGLLGCIFLGFRHCASGLPLTASGVRRRQRGKMCGPAWEPVGWGFYTTPAASSLPVLELVSGQHTSHRRAASPQPEG